MNNQEMQKVMAKRGKSIRRGIAIAVILVGSAAALVFLDYKFRVKGEQNVNFFWISAIICGLLIIINVLLALHSYKKAEKQYKSRIVQKVFKSYHLLYWANQTEETSQYNISFKEFKQARLIDNGESSYVAEDLVTGMINNLLFRSADIKCHRKQASGGMLTLFDGRVYTVGVPLINPDLQILIYEEGIYFCETKGLEEIECDDEDFSEHFYVFANDKEKGKKFLTPQVIETIINAKGFFKGKLLISMCDKKFYVAIYDNDSRFEYGTATKIKDVQAQVEREMECVARVGKMAEILGK